MSHPERKCNGGATGIWCGKRATLVVSKPSGLPSHPLQWFACAEPAHHDGGETEPIGQWFERLGLDFFEGEN